MENLFESSLGEFLEKDKVELMKNRNIKTIRLDDIVNDWLNDKNLSRFIPKHYYKKYKIRKKTK